MFKKALSLCLALLMVATMCVSMVSCGESEDEFKLGVILLHDETSTYDLNFIEAVERAAKELGLEKDQVIYKKNIAESNACYDAAVDLAENGCDIIFADSFGHESYMMKAAEEPPERRRPVRLREDFWFWSVRNRCAAQPGSCWFQPPG